MSTLIAAAKSAAEREADPRKRIHLTGAILVFEAACAMDELEPDKAPRVAVAWGRLKALVEGYSDGDRPKG